MGGVQVCQRRNRNSDNSNGSQVSVEEVELWSAQDSMELCAEGEEHIFRSRAKLLDVAEVSTVAAAVQSLNEGRQSLPEGFGVVHSTTRGRYFLLWQQDRKSLALERLGVEEADLEMLARQRQQLSQPLRRPSLKRDTPEFAITLDRTDGLPLGVDVQKAADQRLIVEGVGESGLVASWNASNPNHQVRCGDHIVEVNGRRGDAEAIVNECRQLQRLVMSILPHSVAAEEFCTSAVSSAERRDASCNTSPYDPNEEPPRAEVCLAMDAEMEPSSQRASGGSLAGSSSLSSALRAPQPPLQSQTMEYAIELDRTDGSRLGVDVVPAHELGPTANLLIEGISEGLVKAWNDSHPDLQVEIGDSIVEVNDCRGNLQKMIDECKKDQLLRVKLQRVVDKPS